MSSKRCTEGYKVEAVKQITDLGMRWQIAESDRKNEPVPFVSIHYPRTSI